jgi:hypothetical protein
LFYLHREQYGLAADMAKRALERKLDNRLGSNNVLRRAYISDLVRRDDIQQAIGFYHDQLPGALTTPLDVDLQSPQNSNQLVEIALLLKAHDPASERAVELIDAAEQKMQLWDERFLPWQRALDRATVAAVRNNKQAALEQLQQAYELGLRMRWRSLLFTNIAYNSLHAEPEFRNLVAKLEEDLARQREEAYKIPGVLR